MAGCTVCRSVWCIRRWRSSVATRRRSGGSAGRSRTWGSTTCSPMTMCSARSTPTGRPADRSVHRAGPVPRPVRDVRVSGRHHGTDRVRHRGADPAAASDGAGGPAGRRRCSPAAGSASGVGSAGARWSTRPWAKTSAAEAPARRSRSRLLRRLFTDPVVDFVGRFDRVDRAALLPKPAHSVPDLAWRIQ